jgi:hypothetical protein
MPGSRFNIAIAWIGAISYVIQIYFDFSGYSDMAIGLGRMFGFEFIENFNYPYIASSVQDFWKRWHISLTSWFREYLYFPLGGNRKGKLRTSINRLTVFFFTGTPRTRPRSRIPGRVDWRCRERSCSGPSPGGWWPACSRRPSVAGTGWRRSRCC